eukprot:gnl/TRDRNA2_/TRDRNA2_166274_c0_seq2.p2 gnl/TRDRNA2_/TRDRNA2_166274_c0~~gnl/TRDRNA2_/TRDRNA2_166274_c0_seq2.p2  ORF type:complete len:107 (+),score=6.36 gnl/TRDRNA2_/TRDRNA2_166274_c0_seq2:38-358(+)
MNNLFVTQTGLVQLVNTCLYPPFVERKFLVAVRSLRLFTFGTMLCGLMTVILEDPTSYLPMGALAIITCLILLHVLTMMCSIPLRRPGVEVHAVPHSPEALRQVCG